MSARVREEASLLLLSYVRRTLKPFFWRAGPLCNFQSCRQVPDHRIPQTGSHSSQKQTEENVNCSRRQEPANDNRYMYLLRPIIESERLIFLCTDSYGGSALVFFSSQITSVDMFFKQ